MLLKDKNLCGEGRIFKIYNYIKAFSEYDYESMIRFSNRYKII